MRRTELTHILHTEYKRGLPCGVEKIAEKGLENTWFVVPPAPPENLPKGLPPQAIREGILLLEKLPCLDEADSLDRLISYLFIRREAVQSSRMEGTWSTIDHVLTPGELFDSSDEKSGRASVIRYAHVLEKELIRAQKGGVKILTSKLASKLHQEIMKKDPTFQGEPGKLRERAVFIGGIRRKEESIYNPTPPRHITRCLNEVMSWMSDETLVDMGNIGMGIPLPVRMAIGHSHFEAVHPFSDGNGRVGRMLMTLQMAAHGVLPLYLSGFIEAEKREYISALQAAQKKLNYRPLVEFTCEAIRSAYQENLSTKSKILALPLKWQKRGSFRKGSAAARALIPLLGAPIFGVKQLQTVLEISAPAAHHAVTQLIEAKIIRERTQGLRNRIFAAEEVIELLSK